MYNFFFFLLVQKRFNNSQTGNLVAERVLEIRAYIHESLVHFEASRTSKKKKIEYLRLSISPLSFKPLWSACHAIHIGNLHHIETVCRQEDVAL